MKQFMVSVAANIIANIVTAGLGYLALAALGILPVFPELVAGIIFALLATLLSTSAIYVAFVRRRTGWAIVVFVVGFLAMAVGMTVSSILTGYPTNSWEAAKAVLIPGGILAVALFAAMIVFRDRIKDML